MLTLNINLYFFLKKSLCGVLPLPKEVMFLVAIVVCPSVGLFTEQLMDLHETFIRGVSRVKEQSIKLRMYMLLQVVPITLYLYCNVWVLHG